MKVDDIVEVIKALDFGEEEWVGRQLVVKSIGYEGGSRRSLEQGRIRKDVEKQRS